MKLYVKSEKIEQLEYTMPHKSGGGHWCSAAYRSKGTTKHFTDEDNEAMEYLKLRGVIFNLVDLSDSTFKNRLLAKVAGVNRTPTLVLDNGAKIKGLNEIRRSF